MAKFAVVYTLHMGPRERQHIIEAWIEDVPNESKTADVAEALKASKYLGDFSERGVFLGNRRIMTEASLPKRDLTADAARSISWEELSAPSSKVQLNVRVTQAERAAYMNAAAAAGLPLAEWVRQTLGKAAGA